MTNVNIIADSKNEFGNRITSAICTFPRYLLAEVNTHRMLSRNSASSRAIRFEKMVESVMKNPFIPQKWQKDHAGMQGTEYFNKEDRTFSKGSGYTSDITFFESTWLKARNNAIAEATTLNKNGLTKQICNRLLEPFMYHTALITGTEIENFFALRAEEHAEIHFQELAYKWLEAMNASEPKQLKAGEWHIPFGDQINDELLWNAMEDHQMIGKTPMEAKVAVATVRCARISYVVPGSEQKINYTADLELHDRLERSGHYSAFEHCARAMTTNEFESHVSGVAANPDQNNGREDFMRPARGWCGNFRGFIQYRKMFADENRTDNRLLKK